MAWTGEGSDAVVSAGSTTGSLGFSFVSTRTGIVFTLIAVGAWSGHQRALKLRASKGMMWTLSLTRVAIVARLAPGRQIPLRAIGEQSIAVG